MAKAKSEPDPQATEGLVPGSPEYSAAVYGGTPEDHTIPEPEMTIEEEHHRDPLGPDAPVGEFETPSGVPPDEPTEG